ncbi:DUF6708 domain-containing protein [Stenotrophomonas sp. LARHCG68]
MAKLKETCVPVWKQPELQLAFDPRLHKSNAHARRNPYRVLPSNYRESLCVDPVSVDAILRVYPFGLEVGTVRGEYAKNVGWSKFSAFFMWAVSIFMLVATFNMWAGSGFRVSAFLVYFVSLIAFASYFIFCFGFYFWRLATWSSLDDPVLFNQKTRMVYVLPYEKGGFFRFWKDGMHGAPVAYSWDRQIHARIYSYFYRGGGSVAEGFELGLLAVREGTNNEVERLIQLGVQSNGFDSTQLALWEHIRQYMEEDGPPLQPGDKLRATDLSRVPEFPPEIVAAAGGPALDQEAIDQLVQQKARP